MITLAPDDNISSQMITLDPDDNMAFQMIHFVQDDNKAPVDNISDNFSSR